MRIQFAFSEKSGGVVLFVIHMPDQGTRITVCSIRPKIG